MVTVFEMNERAYATDTETLSLLRSVVISARKAGDFSAVIAIMVLGEKTGRVVEILDPATFPDLTAAQRCGLGKYAKPMNI